MVNNYTADYMVAFGAFLTSGAVSAFSTATTTNFGPLGSVLIVIGAVFVVVGTLERFVYRQMNGSSDQK